MLNGKVETWYMTKEELAAYVEKHPIKATPRREKAFANIKTYGERSKKGAKK